MMKHHESNIQSVLQQISDVLMMNGGFLSNPGLYTGDMGIVLFFARYARYTQNSLYLDYAYELIEKIQKRIHQHTPTNYREGLTGIGSAIEYLVQNDYFEADTDEILENLDERIFFTYHLKNLSIDIITDIGYYIIWRMSGNSKKKSMMQYIILPQIVDVLDTWDRVNDSKSFLLSFLKSIVSTKRFISQNHYSIIQKWHQLCWNKIPDGFWQKVNHHYSEQFLKNTFLEENKKYLGLQNGLAGWGLFLLTEFDGDNTWISLLSNDFYTIDK